MTPSSPVPVAAVFLLGGFPLAPLADLRAQDPCFAAETVILTGIVRSVAGIPIPDVVVLVSWNSGQAATSSEEDGSYVVCGIPIATSLDILASSSATAAGPVHLALPEAGRYELDLTVPPTGNATGFAGIAGMAVDANTGEPIVGARISVPEASAEALTGRDGEFRFRRLRAGEQEIVLEHVAYGERSTIVEVPEAATAQVRLRVPPRAIEVAPIEVVVEGRRVHSLEVRGFYERREWGERLGLGTFLTDEGIRRRNTTRVSYLVSGISSMELVRVCQATCYHLPKVTSAPSRYGRRGMSPCPADIFVNGVRARIWSWGPDNNLVVNGGIDELVIATEIAGLEIYRRASELPAEFGGATDGCGAVVIWTK